MDRPLLPTASVPSILALLSSKGFPAPTEIKPLSVEAAFHSIYLIQYSPGVTFPPELAHLLGPDGSLDMILRVAGRHLPGIKTRNEVGVMEWVRENTSIPIPRVILYDATDDNALQHEYTLMGRASGVSVDTLYSVLSEERKHYLVEQFVDYIIQLHSHPWPTGLVGGLILNANGGIEDGPPVDETFWLLTDIETYWDKSETLNSLNPIDGAFPSWTASVSGYLDRYVHAIQGHPQLEAFRDLVPRLEAFQKAITTEFSSEINSVKHVLAHRDLHFGNVLCDPETAQVTAVLDWEFAGVVPAPGWNPVRAFLWNVQNTPEGFAERDRLFAIFTTICQAKGANWLLEEVGFSPKQEAMVNIVNHLRNSIHACVKNRGVEKLAYRRDIIEKALTMFSV
ncbi:kinase-like domain-containing protein [Xylariales sp. PMI_506]|nr:kinase-like domain-containing protein [Xylariales sp. PMI_506]